MEHADTSENQFLEQFSARGREQLLERVIEQHVGPGEYLFHEGEKARGVCLIQDGEIEITKKAGEREHVLADFGPGHFLGEVAVLDGEGRSTNARARTAASVSWIPTEDLLDVLHGEPPELMLHIFRNVLTLLRRTNDLYIDEAVRKEKLSLMGEIAGSLMHDLRNPVQVILSAVELLRMIHPDADTADCCDKMQAQCERLIAMAGEMLEFSRGETKLHLAHTSIEALMDQFRATSNEIAKPEGAEFEITFEPAEIEIDVMRILRVLQNLATNAAQALGDRPSGRIDVQAWVADGMVFLSVRDNGPGIPPQVRDRLFEPFVTHGKTGGTGLGLAIVKNVVTAHRGQISFETQAGQGTEFLIRLPQDAASPPVE